MSGTGPKGRKKKLKWSGGTGKLHKNVGERGGHLWDKLLEKSLQQTKKRGRRRERREGKKKKDTMVNLQGGGKELRKSRKKRGGEGWRKNHIQKKRSAVLGDPIWVYDLAKGKSGGGRQLSGDFATRGEKIPKSRFSKSAKKKDQRVL